MCLIAYSPTGELIPRNVFDYAKRQNPDGIGIVAADGSVEKFLGRRWGRRAWRHLARLTANSTPYAIHFRWATHGAVTRANTHPFKTRNGAWVMHNGVISLTSSMATAEKSDTALFVELFTPDFPEPSHPESAEYVATVEKLIGWGNKLVVFHPSEKTFTICNEEAGEWIEGFWYSNTYSLPSGYVPRSRYASAWESEWESDWGYPGQSAAWQREFGTRSLTRRGGLWVPTTSPSPSPSPVTSYSREADPDFAELDYDTLRASRRAWREASAAYCAACGDWAEDCCCPEEVRELSEVIFS